MIRKLLNKLRGEPNIDKLKKQGMKVGDNFSYGMNCFFDPAHCFLISIGDNVTFSTHIHIVAHDASPIKHIGYAKIGCVNIGNDVFVGANTTILPGVTIGDKTIVGAGSVVVGDCEEKSVYAGVPAKKICSLEEYLEKNRTIEDNMIFGEEFTVRGGITEERKNEMKRKLEENKLGLIK